MESGVERPPRSGRSGRGNRSHHESLAGDRGRLLALVWMVIKSGGPWDVELGGSSRRSASVIFWDRGFQLTRGGSWRLP